MLVVHQYAQKMASVLVYSYFDTIRSAEEFFSLFHGAVLDFGQSLFDDGSAEPEVLAAIFCRRMHQSDAVISKHA